MKIDNRPRICLRRCISLLGAALLVAPALAQQATSHGSSGADSRRTDSTTFSVSRISGEGMGYDPSRNRVSSIEVERRTRGY